MAKKILFTVISSITLLIIILLVYSFVIVKKARSITKEKVPQLLQHFEIKYSDLTKPRLDAILAVEDPAFFRHKGIDLKTPGAGLTTITQGIGKKLYFRSFKPGLAKYKLMLVSRFALDPLVSKEDQLTLFLNITYLGHYGSGGAVGFQDAAEKFFRKDFKSLSEDEFLSLLAMVIAPNTFHVIENPDSNRERVERMKRVISGEYKPRNLMDLYYGKLGEKELKNGLAPASYFPGMYENKEKKEHK